MPGSEPPPLRNLAAGNPTPGSACGAGRTLSIADRCTSFCPLHPPPAARATSPRTPFKNFYWGRLSPTEIKFLRRFFQKATGFKGRSPCRRPQTAKFLCFLQAQERVNFARSAKEGEPSPRVLLWLCLYVGSLYRLRDKTVSMRYRFSVLTLRSI